MIIFLKHNSKSKENSKLSRNLGLEFTQNNSNNQNHKKEIQTQQKNKCMSTFKNQSRKNNQFNMIKKVNVWQDQTIDTLLPQNQ